MNQSPVWGAGRLLFSRHEVASLLNLSLRSVDSLLASGRIDSVKLGRRRLVSRDQLLNLGGHSVREKLGL